MLSEIKSEEDLDIGLVWLSLVVVAFLIGLLTGFTWITALVLTIGYVSLDLALWWTREFTRYKVSDGRTEPARTER
jgi:hypothetical protein